LEVPKEPEKATVVPADTVVWAGGLKLNWAAEQPVGDAVGLNCGVGNGVEVAVNVGVRVAVRVGVVREVWVGEGFGEPDWGTKGEKILEQAVMRTRQTNNPERVKMRANNMGGLLKHRGCLHSSSVSVGGFIPGKRILIMAEEGL
jgi:hypothetical protein